MKRAGPLLAAVVQRSPFPKGYRLFRVRQQSRNGASSVDVQPESIEAGPHSASFFCQQLFYSAPGCVFIKPSIVTVQSLLQSSIQALSRAFTTLPCCAKTWRPPWTSTSAHSVRHLQCCQYERTPLSVWHGLDTLIPHFALGIL